MSPADFFSEEAKIRFAYDLVGEHPGPGPCNQTF